MVIKSLCPAEEGTRVDMTRDGKNWVLHFNDTTWKVDKNPDLIVLGRDQYKVIMDGSGGGDVVLYADLHGHTDNSLLDGLVKVQQKAGAAEYCSAITDHGTMTGVFEFFKEMKALDKKPIIGFEAYCQDLDGELKKNHLILLAKNLQGYKNLLKLCSEASEHFHGKPHVTWEMLEKYHDGVICLSACLAGIIPRYILDGNMDKAREARDRYHAIFGEDFYIEIQNHHIADEDIVRPVLVKLAKEIGVQYVATVDSHYLRPEDTEAHELLLCLSTKKTMDEPHMKFQGDGYYIHSSEEMAQLFRDYPEALDASLDIADKVDLKIPMGMVNLPTFEVPEGFKDDVEYFEYLCKKGFEEHFAGTKKLKDKVYLDRFQYELDMVKQMGFPGYFLIVWDYINYARSQGIYVGPGRGSAAGSLLAYCLGITDLDPIQYNLLFERFLNPERVSMPDVDTDFEHTRRHEVYEYCQRKYGVDHVSHIVTFGTMAARLVVKDVARTLGMPPYAGAAIAKEIPSEPGMTIDKAMDMNPELKNMYDSQADVKKVIDLAKILEGSKRHSSQHACGVLVAPGPISDWIPTALMTDDDTGEKGLTAQATAPECEELSILKFDFLGLKNMTVIHEVHDGVIRDYGLKNILKQIGSKRKEFRYQDIPMTDRATYKMLAEGLTSGVFQLESDGMTNVVTEMLADIDRLPDEELGQCFERLIAAVALFRPGPMDYIPEYQAGMRNQSHIHYDTPLEESILKTTYGVLVFQEQLMQIAQKLAGYSLGEADIIRKGCAKKKQKLLDAEKKRFIYGNKEDVDAGKATHFVPGCMGNGISEATAEEIWGKIVKFGAYAFNRSHAACYAYIAYITAYMSCHWPEHFFCAMMNAFIENSDKMKLYLSHAVRRGIKILPPDINRSTEQFTVDMEAGGIRFGIRGISGINKITDDIVEERETNGPFTDMHNFYNRMFDRGVKLSQNQMDKLVFAGAFSGFKYNRREQQMLSSLVIKDSESSKGQRTMGQCSLFDAPEFDITPPVLEEYNSKELLDKEYEALGIYLSGHPVTAVYNKALQTLKPAPTSIVDLGDKVKGGTVTVIGQIRNLTKRFTRSGDIMMNFDLTDQFTSIRCVVFPRDMNAVEMALGEGRVIGVVGKFSMDEDFGNQVIVNAAYSETAIMMARQPKLVVTVIDKNDQEKLMQFISQHKGATPVYLKVPNSDKEYKTGRKIGLNVKVLDELLTNWKVSA